ncbi:unnamed protein product [Soboliphyme baturini]|uniref:Peptidase_M24 domain-containing protein n=1 Tax=Soboliphyme baturini TaxID=241478 RepID=A0A183J4W6_9BILA|nr:unnamed protein product [Soboliphyme baturini]
MLITWAGSSASARKAKKRFNDDTDKYAKFGRAVLLLYPGMEIFEVNFIGELGHAVNYTKINLDQIDQVKVDGDFSSAYIDSQ